MKPTRFVRTSALASGLVLLALPASSAVLNWDITPGTIGAGDSAITGGSGTWDVTNGNWTADAGATNVAWINASNDAAVFGGTGGTVTLGAGVTANALTFDVSGYSLISNTLTFAGTTPTVIANSNATIGSVIAGTAGLTKAGTGTLILTGSNTYTGGTTITAGMLQIGDGTSNPPSAGTYVISSGATLRLNRLTAFTPAYASITGAGTLSLNSAQAINGTANWGTAALPAGFTGKLLLQNGRVEGSAAQVGGTTAFEILNGGQFLALGTGGVFNQSALIAGNGWGESGFPGAIRAAAGATSTWNGAITLTAASSILTQTSGATLTFTGPVTGPYQLDFNSIGTITLTPAVAVQNSYGSTLKTGSGTLTAGNAFAYSTGPLTVNAGTLRLNGNSFSFANLSGTGGTINNNSASVASTLTVGTDNTSTSFAGSFANGSTATLALTKVGTGALTLTGGTRTQTGPTTVDAGTLLVSSGAYSTSAVTVNAGATFGGAVTAGGVTINAGGTLQGGFGGAGNLTATSLSFGGSSTVNVLALSPATANVAVSGAVTTSGVQTINITNAASPALGVSRLISFGSLAGDGAGAFVLGSVPPQGGGRARVYTLDTSNPAYVAVNVTGDSAIWSGAIDGAWDSTTANWKASSDLSSTTFLVADSVIFDNTAVLKTLSINGANVTPSAVAFNNSTGNDYVLGGSFGIAGTGSVTKTGTGKITFSGGAHSFSGALSVSNGTLSIPTINNVSAAGTLGNSALPVTLGDAGGITGVLEYTGATASSSKPLGVATGGVGEVSVTNAANTLTLSGVISGSGSFTKSGPGILILTATNTFTGSLSAKGGIVQIGTLPTTAVGNSSLMGSGDVILDGGTFRYSGTGSGSDGGAKFSRPFTIGASGGTFQFSGANTNPVWWSSTITGSGPLTLTHTGGQDKQWLYTGNSSGTFARPVFIGGGVANSGHIQLRNGGQIGSGTITLNVGGTLGFDTGPAASISNPIVLNGGTIKTEGVTVAITGTVLAATGTTSTLNLGNVAFAPLTLSGAFSGSGSITNASRTATLTLSGDNSAFTGVFTHSPTVGTANTLLNSTASASAAGRWVTTAGSLLANVAGSNTFSFGSLAGTGGIVGNNLGGSTATFSVGALNTDATFAGSFQNVTGTTALTKVGTGTLTLSGSNTLSGDTIVSAGRLNVTGSLTASPLTVESGATLSGTGTVAAATVSAGGRLEGGAAGSGKLTLSTLAFSGAGTVGVGTLSNYAATPGLQVNTLDSLTAAGGPGSVTLSVADLGTASAGNTYKLISYSGTIGGGFSSFALAPLPGRVSGSLVDNAGSVDLLIGSAPVSVVYTGATDANWDVATSNWKLASDNSPTTFQTADALVFDDTANASRTTLTLLSAVSPSTLTASNSSLSYVFQGSFPIALTGPLTKSGSGSLTFANSASSFASTVDVAGGSVVLQTGGHSFAGAVTVSGGTLSVPSTGNSFGGNLTINTGTVDLQGSGNSLNGSALAIKGGTYIVPSLNSTGAAGPLGATATVTLGDAGGVTGTILYTGATTSSGKPLSIANGGTGSLQVDQAGATVTLSGVISGASGTLAKSGPGALVLTATNTFTGGVAINGGSISVGTLTNATSSPLGAGTTLSLDGGTLIYTGGNTGSDAAPTFTRALTVGASGGTLDLTAGFVHYNGTMSGSGTFTVNSTGSTGVNAKQLFFEGNSPAFDGDIVVNGAAQIRTNNTNTLGSAVGSTIVNTDAIFAVDNGAAAVNITVPENFTLNGGFFGVQNGSLTTTGTVTVSTASQVGHAYTGYSAGTLTFGGGLVGSAPLTFAGNGGDTILTTVGCVRLNGAGPNTFSGPIRLIRERLELGVTTGPAFASTAVTIGDATVAGSRGVVRLIAADQIPDAAVVTFENQGTSPTVGDFGFLDLNGFNETIAGLTDATTRAIVEASETVVSLASTLTLAPATGQTYTFAGYARNTSSGTGTVLSLVKNGEGTQVLSGSNITYSGSTTINEGVLRLTDTSGFASDLTLNIPGSLELTRSSADWTLSRALNGSGDLKIAAGSGIITLSGVSNFDGGTTVQSGTVRLGSGSALGQGPVSLSTGTTLDLNGQALADLNEVSVPTGASLTGSGSLTISGSVAGTVSPGGTSAGRITSDSSLVLASGSVLSLGLGGTTRHTGSSGTYDTLQVTGTATLAGTINVTLINGFVPVSGQSFQLVGATSLAGSPTLNLPALTGTLIWDTSAFAATGVVSVDGVGGYAQSFGLTGPNAAPGADPDGDGLSNALEFAFGINPTENNGSDYRTQASTSSGALVLTYRRPLGGVAGVTYGVEVKSTDLVVGNTGWTTAVEGIGNDYTQSVNDNGDGTATVTITLNGAVSGKKFARVSVTY